MAETSPIRPTDDEARGLARGLLAAARFGALGVTEPDTGAPMVTRVAVALGGNGNPLLLISSLSQHTRALRAAPACSLLVGEPGPKGDPLTHPRLTVQARAEFVDRTGSDHEALRARWLGRHPKAKLYIDFADFSFVRLIPVTGYLNGGFGKAFVLDPADMAER